MDRKYLESEEFSKNKPFYLELKLANFTVNSSEKQEIKRKRVKQGLLLGNCQPFVETCPMVKAHGASVKSAIVF